MVRIHRFRSFRHATQRLLGRAGFAAARPIARFYRARRRSLSAAHTAAMYTKCW